jgi:hypothetical protein
VYSDVQSGIQALTRFHIWKSIPTNPRLVCVKRVSARRDSFAETKRKSHSCASNACPFLLTGHKNVKKNSHIINDYGTSKKAYENPANQSSNTYRNKKEVFPETPSNMMHTSNGIGMSTIKKELRCNIGCNTHFSS